MVHALWLLLLLLNPAPPQLVIRVFQLPHKSGGIAQWRLHTEVGVGRGRVLGKRDSSTKEGGCDRMLAAHPLPHPSRTSSMRSRSPCRRRASC